MNSKLNLILGGMFLFSQTAMAANVFPSGTSFTVEANVPESTGVSITVNSVDSATGKVYTPVTTNVLNFGTLTFTTTGTPPINVYLPANFFALDIAPSAGGTGTPDTTFTYTEGTNQNGTTNGLGTKSSITFAQEVYTSATTAPTETVLTTYGPKMLSQISATEVPNTALTSAGAWLRAYVGICTGNTSTDPAGCTPFTNKDNHGQYTGSLLVTATLH